jgi:hypothetical protein
VQLAGINPYRYLPVDDDLAFLRDEAVYPHINRAEYAHSVYPPAAQVIFALAAAATPGVLGMKVMIAAFDALAIVALILLLRTAGRVADAEFASRKAVRLLCHEADVRGRLDAPVANRITAARNGIARILEVSLRYAGRELLRSARESAQPGADPAAAQEAFVRAEAYNRLVAEAHRVTGGVDVPVFLPDHVARLRAEAGVGAARVAGPAAAETAAAMSTVKVPVITQKILAARAAAAATSKAAPAARVGPAVESARKAPAQAAAAPGPATPRPRSAVPVAPGAGATAAGRPADAPKTKPSLPRLRGIIVA